MKKLLIIIGLIYLAGTGVQAQSSSSVQPPNGLSEIAAYSIFYENYKNEDYLAAINYGRWMWKNMPKSIKGYSKFELEKNLNRLVTSYSQAAQGSDDPSQRSAYLDTAQIIFEKAFTDLKDQIDPYEWHLTQGRFYQQNSDFIDNGMAKATAEYKKAFEEKPKELTKLSDGYYIQTMIQNMVSDGKKDEALEYIEKAEPNAPKKLKDYFNSVRNKLFDSPKERITFLESQMKKNPKDQKVMSELRDLYVQQEMIKKAAELNQKLYEINPSYENAKALADLAIKNADYDKAIKYLNEAMSKAANDEDKARLALELSDAYKNKEDLQQAHKFAKQAADLNSKWGQPYIQIASIYAQAVNNCTSGRKIEREDKVVYWLVLDYLDKAKQVDSSVSNRVQQQYESYKPVTPTTEDKFFKGWKAGQKMKVDGSLNSCYSWIGETTTVR